MNFDPDAPDAISRAERLEAADLWCVDDLRHPAKPSYAFLVLDDVVIQSAPIARYLEGKTLSFALTYLRGRGAKVYRIEKSARSSIG